MHAATYFGDADAQYRLGELYLDENELGDNPLQSARWLSLAARKGHAAAQATLGNLLFNGDEGLEPQPEEGLMWLTVASRRVAGTADEAGSTTCSTPPCRSPRPTSARSAQQMAEFARQPQFGGLLGLRTRSSPSTGTWSLGFSQPRTSLCTQHVLQPVGGLRRAAGVVDADAVVAVPAEGLEVPERVAPARRSRRACASVRPRLSSARQRAAALGLEQRVA